MAGSKIACERGNEEVWANLLIYMAIIPILNSIDAISKQYPTGEVPVLVMCSDMNLYNTPYYIARVFIADGNLV